jgi:hypothetical protein
MSRRTTFQRSFRKAQRRARKLLRRAGQALRRARKALRAAPLPVRVAVIALGALTVGLSANWLYQVVRKPSELFFPVSGVLAKTPTETWRSYEPLFRRHSTELITADLLAALAQIEASGNPVTRTYWRWRLSTNPLELYRPASSAVGMYQLLDGTFVEARRYCIHRHAVREEGRWYDPRSCWFNGLYTRVIPSHAVELTSAYLHTRVTRSLARQRIAAAKPRQTRDLAGVIHLCGSAAGDAFAKRGFRVGPGQRCGSHGLASYLSRLEAMRRVFARLATDT